MEIGRVDMFEKYIDDLSDKKTLDKLLNNLGYDKGRENSTRRRIYPSIEGRNSQDQGDQLQGSLQDTDEENVDLRFRSEAVKATRRVPTGLLHAAPPPFHASQGAIKLLK